MQFTVSASLYREASNRSGTLASPSTVAPFSNRTTPLCPASPRIVKTNCTRLSRSAVQRSVEVSRCEAHIRHFGFFFLFRSRNSAMALRMSAELGTRVAREIFRSSFWCPTLSQMVAFFSFIMSSVIVRFGIMEVILSCLSSDSCIWHDLY